MLVNYAHYTYYTYPYTLLAIQSIFRIASYIQIVLLKSP